MTFPDDSHWKAVAWNGISLDYPADWDPIISGETHILFEKDFNPVFELRWQKQKNSGRVSLDTILSRITKEAGLPELTPIPIPWKRYTENFAIRLLGNHDNTTPEAAIFICRECKTTLLFYFFNELIEKQKQIILQLLSSVSCHRDNDCHDICWKIQDFQVLLPDTFEISGHNFGAGLTRLSFVHSGLTMHLCRMASASQRLKDSSLLNLMNLLGDIEVSQAKSQLQENEVSHRSYPSLLQQIRSRMKRKAPFHWVILRHHPELDRLSGLFFYDKKPIPETLVSVIENNYEISPL